MQTLNSRTIAHLAKRLAPELAAHLATLPRPVDGEADAEALLSEIQAAVILGLRPATLCSWRSRGRGPGFLKIGPGTKPAIKYRRRVIIAFRDARESNPER